MSYLLCDAPDAKRCGDCGAIISLASDCDHAGATTFRDETGTIRVAGYYGTTDAASHYAEHSRIRRDNRIAVLRATGRATGEGAFSDMAAPSGIGEPVERTVTTADTMPAGGNVETARRAARYIVGHAMHEHDAAYRRATMAQARRDETARRARAAINVETPTLHDAARHTTPVADEWRGIPLRTVVALASIPRDDAIIDPAVPRDILTALETAYAARRAHVAAITALAATTPDRDGRGTYVDPRASWGVNATEVRHAERWHATPRTAVLSEYGHPLDWTCYSMRAGFTVPVPFVPEPRETGTSSTRPVENVEHVEHVGRMRAMVSHLTAGIE